MVLNQHFPLVSAASAACCMPFFVSTSTAHDSHSLLSHTGAYGYLSFSQIKSILGDFSSSGSLLVCSSSPMLVMISLMDLEDFAGMKINRLHSFVCLPRQGSSGLLGSGGFCMF